MRILTSGLFLLVTSMPAMAASSLDVAIDNVRATCGAISQELSDMKTRAGIGTAVSAAGTVGGAVAVGAGIAKSNTDKSIEQWRQKLQEMAAKDKSNGVTYSLISQEQLESASKEAKKSDATVENPENKISELEQKSKRLGDIRTGTLAASTATNIAGAVVSGMNRTSGELQQKINSCIESVSELSRVRMQARLDGSAEPVQLAHAERIVSECGVWETVNISSIDNRAKGATVSSGIGAGLGLVGTITSASANSDKVREGDDQKEQNLNKAANILAGGTTIASGAATVFNATQISAIKRAAQVADLCEGALK